MRAREVPDTTGRHLSAVGERAKSPAAYQSPTGLQHRHPRSHYACTQSHTQATLFATLTPRGASRASQQQRCETRGLLFLIAAHAVLWSTRRLCSIARYALQEFSKSAWFRMITQRPLHCHSPHPCSLTWVADTGPGLYRLLRTFRRTILLQSMNIVPLIARVFAHVNFDMCSLHAPRFQCHLRHRQVLTRLHAFWRAPHPCPPFRYICAGRSPLR